MQNKFFNDAIKYFSNENKNNFKIEMDSSTYGIRAQLINRENYELVNDFILK